MNVHSLTKSAESKDRRCRLLRGYLDWLCKIFVILFKRREGGDPCVYIPEKIINRPDPCIYSQFLLMQLDQPVTWDNPDVKIFKDGVEQYTYDLTVDTKYDIEITVHNSSREKEAHMTKVDVQWIEFGAGAQIRHPISTIMTNVPLYPGVSKVNTQWQTPASPGHYCIEVELEHPEDGNPSNNRGWNNTQVKAAESEVQTPIRIFNQWLEGCPPPLPPLKDRTWWPIILGYGVLGLLVGLTMAYYNADKLPGRIWIYWAIAGYIIGIFAGYAIRGPPFKQRQKDDDKRVPCNLVELFVDSYRFEDKKGKEADPDKMFGPHPPAWPARVEPNIFHFDEGETYRDVMLIVDAPDKASATEVFNVSARQGGEPIGGVSVTIKPKKVG